MDKSSKKYAAKVPPVAVLAPDGKSEKKCKRNAYDDIEKAASAKKQKTVPDKKLTPKEVECSSSDEDSSESKDKVLVQLKKAAAPAKRKSSSDSSSESGSDDEPARKPAAASKKPAALASKGSKNYKSDSCSDEDEDCMQDMPTKAPAVAKKTEEFSGSSDSESSDSEKPATEVKNSTVATVQRKNQELNSSDSDSDDSSDETKPYSQATVWSRTLFVQNLPCNVKKVDVKHFFQQAGEVTDVQFISLGGDFKGFGSVEFGTIEATKKAFDELNYHELSGQAITLTYAGDSPQQMLKPNIPAKVKEKDEENSARDVGKDEPKLNKPKPPALYESDVWSRTVFVGNLSHGVEIEQVRRFLEAAGQIIDVRFATSHEKTYMGLVQAEFVTAEGAKMAFKELSGRSLAGQAVRLYHAHERGTAREVFSCGLDPVVFRFRQNHITSTFCLDIPNYAQLQGMGVGERLETPAFSLGGFSWEIHFYPDGADEEYAEYASAVLCCTSAEIPKAELSFRVLDQGNEFVYDGLAHNVSQDQLQRELGFLDFMEQYRLMELGPFRMQFILTVIHESPLDPRVAHGLKNDLEDLLSSGMGADVIFDVGGREIPAHSFILRARSPVLFAQLGGWIPDEEEDVSDDDEDASDDEDVAVAKDVTRIVIDNVDPDIFELMLHFIYTDEMPWPNYDTGETYSTEVFEHLVVAADYYGLQNLRILCEKRLGGRLEEQTVMGRFIFAEQYNLRELKHRCLQVMSREPESKRDRMGRYGRRTGRPEGGSRQR